MITMKLRKRKEPYLIENSGIVRQNIRVKHRQCADKEIK